MSKIILLWIQAPSGMDLIMHKLLFMRQPYNAEKYVLINVLNLWKKSEQKNNNSNMIICLSFRYGNAMFSVITAFIIMANRRNL